MSLSPCLYTFCYRRTMFCFCLLLCHLVTKASDCDKWQCQLLLHRHVRLFIGHQITRHVKCNAAVTGVNVCKKGLACNQLQQINSSEMQQRMNKVSFFFLLQLFMMQCFNKLGIQLGFINHIASLAV